MATEVEDMEEYQTTFLTNSDFSATSLPPLEVLPVGMIHENAFLYTTVLDTMKQAVPIDVKASRVGTKKSGLFFVGEEPMPAGEMLFLTNPLAMARSPDEEGADKGMFKPDGPPTDANMCDYCFRGPQTFAERGATTKDNTSEAVPPARRCTGCDLLTFCNKTCHRKAWKQFHRFECGILKAMKRRDPQFLLHLRVLLMDKGGAVPENVMKVIRDLSIPFSQPLPKDLEHNVKNCALHAQHFLGLKNRDFTFIRDVLCRILGNQAVVLTADETAIVHCFDIALAQLNHSCEPNAFIFVEGRQTRVRSLRTIQPGDEITVALVDTRLDVGSRREALRIQTLNEDFVCKCSMCDEDLEAMENLVDNNVDLMRLLEQFHTNVVPKAVQLIHTIKQAVWDNKKTDLIHEFVALAEGEFIAHFNQDPMLSVNYKPIPWLRMAGAAMFLDIRELESALYYAAMSFMFHERRFDPMTATGMRILVNTLRAICELPESDKQYKNLFHGHGSEFPELQDLAAFTVSCTIAFGVLAAKVYGPKIGFVRAVIRWGKEGEALCAPLRPCTSAFNSAAERAQRKIMAWCLGDRKAPFYPIDAPTAADYAQLTDILRERDEQLEMADLAGLAGQADEDVAEEYRNVERLAKSRRSGTSNRSLKSARTQQSTSSHFSASSMGSEQSGKALGGPRDEQTAGGKSRSEIKGRPKRATNAQQTAQEATDASQGTRPSQTTQKTRTLRMEASADSGQSGPPGQSGPSGQSGQSDQGSMVMRSYEEKMRAAKQAEVLVKRERDRLARYKQKSSRKEDGNENQTHEDRLQALLDAQYEEMMQLVGKGQVGRLTEKELGEVETARSSTVEEVCRLQMDW